MDGSIVAGGFLESKKTNTNVFSMTSINRTTAGVLKLINAWLPR